MPGYAGQYGDSTLSYSADAGLGERAALIAVSNERSDNTDARRLSLAPNICSLRWLLVDSVLLTAAGREVSIPFGLFPRWTLRSPERSASGTEFRRRHDGSAGMCRPLE